MNGELRALLVCVLAYVHQLSGETNVGQFFSILKNIYISNYKNKQFRDVTSLRSFYGETELKATCLKPTIKIYKINF
jgi:hypothetical protein